MPRRHLIGRMQRRSPFFPETPVQAACDLVIVGAGYAGLTAALVAARAGRSVQVFDLQRPGEGASSRNGGIASGNLQIGLSKMIRSLGTKQAVKIYQEGVSARKDLAAFLDEEGIDCDFKPVGRFTGAMNAKDYEALERETDLINKHLDIGAYTVDRAGQHEEIGTDYYHGGQVRPDIGGLHPAKFHAALLGKVLKEGITVHGETAITGIRANGREFDVGTTRSAVHHFP